MKDKYKDIILQHELRTVVESLNYIDIKILILSASFDKVYSSIYRHIGITETMVDDTIRKIGGGIVIEKNFTDEIESFLHSGYKTIVNSKDYVFRLLGIYIEVGNRNVNTASQFFIEIISKLREDYRLRNYAKSLILFDNLNQIFLKRQGGAINLIFRIYSGLEAVLYTETHYWIQRAKSILNLKRDNEAELNNAINFALKGYYDSKDFSNSQLLASFQISMIYGRLANLTEYNNKTYLNKSIDWYYTALQESSYNVNYINNFIKRAKHETSRNDFYALCSYCILNNPDREFRDKVNFLIKKLQD